MKKIIIIISILCFMFVGIGMNSLKDDFKVTKVVYQINYCEASQVHDHSVLYMDAGGWLRWVGIPEGNTYWVVIYEEWPNTNIYPYLELESIDPWCKVGCTDEGMIYWKQDDDPFWYNVKTDGCVTAPWSLEAHWI